jgi:CheY-like chemotaxis protein
LATQASNRCKPCQPRTALVVCHDRRRRSELRNQFAFLGYNVATASDFETSMDVLLRRQNMVDDLIIDLDPCSSESAAIVTTLRSIHPGIPCLFLRRESCEKRQCWIGEMDRLFFLPEGWNQERLRKALQEMHRTPESLSVLVLTDNEEKRTRIAEQLRSRIGPAARVEFNDQPLRLLETKTFDVIITDIYMREQDGLEVILAVRRAGLSTRIIAIGNGLLESEVQLAWALGVNGVAPEEELGEAIAEFLPGPAMEEE